MVRVCAEFAGGLPQPPAIPILSDRDRDRRRPGPRCDRTGRLLAPTKTASVRRPFGFQPDGIRATARFEDASWLRKPRDRQLPRPRRAQNRAWRASGAAQFETCRNLPVTRGRRPQALAQLLGCSQTRSPATKHFQTAIFSASV